METLISLWNVAKVMLGLGFVIFVHELGHFLLAKWNGVKVEKFSIGFGKTLFGFKRGETEYVIAAIPLGGFVKMLGEGGEAGEGPPDPEAASDPRAFNNKSVGARAAILSAGVIMNVLLAMVCFAYVFGQEREELAARVGTVLAGSPAFEAGLRPGDDIVSIDGRAGVGFEDLLKAVSLSKEGQTLHLQVERPGASGPLDFSLQPRRDASADRPTIGVVFGSSLDVFDYRQPAGTPAPASLPWPPESGETDVLAIKAAGEAGGALAPVDSHYAFLQASTRDRAKPLEVALERRTLGGKPVAGSVEQKATLPPNRFVDLGLRFGVEPIKSIRKGSPAEAAGLLVGDRIVKIDGRDEIDPMRLPLECFDHAGSPMAVEVHRGDAAAPEVVALNVTPDDSPLGDSFWRVAQGEDLQIPGLGVALPIKPVVRGVVADSPAAKASVQVGDVVDTVVIPPSKPRPRRGGAPAESGTREQTLELDKAVAWPFVFGLLQELPIQPLKLAIRGRKEPVAVQPEVVADWFNPDRGLEFVPAYRTLPPLGFVPAVRKGVDETVENIRMVYSMIRSLSTGRVSMNQTAGPIGIFRMANSAAKSSLVDLMRFLGMISINLAVLNFLPIPPLDGGQMLFLAAEKVRGRPLPDSALIAGTYVGLILVLCLMVFATYQDVLRLLREYFFL